MCSMFTVMIAAGETPPPLGMMSVPVGGTMVEQWTEYETQLKCVNATCLCTNHCEMGWWRVTVPYMIA